MNEDKELYAGIIHQLDKLGETVCTAESCTGGNIARCLAMIPGASAVLLGGIVAYAPRMKVELLGVDQQLTLEQTIVSCATATAMASGAIARFGSDWALATTGFAGPTGGNDVYPVGTVCMAILCPKRRIFYAKALHIEGDRQTVIQGATDELLSHLNGVLLPCTRRDVS